MSILFKNTVFYQKKIWHDQKTIILMLSVFAVGFQFAFGWLLFEAKFDRIFESVARLLPQSLMNFIGVTAGSGVYGSQLLSFGYSHPLVLISLSIIPLAVPTRYISGEVENKTIDLLLTKSIPRSAIPVNLFIFICISLIIQSMCIFFGTYLGYIIFSLQIDIIAYFKAVIVICLFFVSMGSVTMFITMGQKERGKALARCVTLFVSLYFFDTIIRLNSNLNHLTVYSYFNLFQPGKVINGTQNLNESLLILGIIIIVFWLLSVVIFNHKDV